MSCNCSSNTEILKMFQELKNDLSQVKNDCFRIRQEILGITDESQEFGLMENVTIRQVMERMAFDIEALKARANEPTRERVPRNLEDAVVGILDNNTVDDPKAPDFETQEDYEQWLEKTITETQSQTRISDGTSIGGLSISSISYSVHSQYSTSITIEIVNYLEEPLVELQTLVPFGFPHGSIPYKVDSLRREVFVYRGGHPEVAIVPQGALSFRIGSGHYQLGTYFKVKSTRDSAFGMALTAFNNSFNDLGWATGSSFPSEVIPLGDLPVDYILRRNIQTNSMFSIENDLTYVLATLFTAAKCIWKIEVFPKFKIQNMISSCSGTSFDFISPGESYRGKTSLALMNTISGTRGIFVEFANALSFPLHLATSYNTDSSSSYPTLNIIPSEKKEIAYWNATSGDLKTLVIYQIGASDIQLAVAANSDPSSGITFGLKFISSSPSACSSVSRAVEEVLAPPGWERNSHKVGRANGGAIVIHIRNLRVTASMTGEPKSLLKIVLEKYF